MGRQWCPEACGLSQEAVEAWISAAEIATGICAETGDCIGLDGKPIEGTRSPAGIEARPRALAQLFVRAASLSVQPGEPSTFAEALARGLRPRDALPVVALDPALLPPGPARAEAMLEKKAGEHGGSVLALLDASDIDNAVLAVLTPDAGERVQSWSAGEIGHAVRRVKRWSTARCSDARVSDSLDRLLHRCRVAIDIEGNFSLLMQPAGAEA